MPKHSHRETILAEGMKVVHARGYAGASVRDIVEAAGVPQGSFTNHFASKEAFGLEVLDRYYERTCERIAETLRNESLTPLARFKAYVDRSDETMARQGTRHGCMIGNFGIETSEHSDVLRERVVEIFREMEQAVAECLKAAVKAGEIPKKTACDEFAGFVISAQQGATLRAKTERSLLPMKRFKKFVMASLLG
jgi:TetR/AcrR family transcriptional repressor of nem operon